MKFTKANLQTKITYIDGEVVQIADKKGNPIDLTLRVAMKDALTVPTRADQESDETDKVERFLLATRIWNADSIELEAEDVALIKKRAIKYFSHAEVVGSIIGLIDPAALKPKKL